MATANGKDPVNEDMHFDDNILPQALLKRLHAMQQNGQHTDVILESGQEAVSCHKLVLAAASPYLANMFADGIDETQSGIVDLQCVDSSVLQLIVNYIYTAQCDVNMDNVRPLTKACETLKLDLLSSACDEYFKANLREDNVFSIYMFAYTMKLPESTETSRKMIATKFQELSKMDDILNLDKEFFGHILACDDLNVENEDFVFDALMKWVEHNSEERQSCITELMKNMRLSHCSTSYLKYTVSKHPLLQSPEFFEQMKEAFEFQLSERQHEICTPTTLPRNKYQTRKLIYTGRDGNHNFITDGSVFSHRPATNYNHVHTHYTTCTIPSGILLTGGYDTHYGRLQSVCHHFNFRSKQWSNNSFPSLQVPRRFHAALYCDGCVYVIGGVANISQSVEMCDVNKEGGWKIATPLPILLSCTSYPNALANGQMIYVLGGQLQDGKLNTHMFAFHPTWKTWTEKAAMPSAHVGLSTSSVNEKIFVLGGTPSVCMSYDTLQDTWTILTNPPGVQAFGCAVVWKGKILLCGGQNESGDGIRTISEYDPSDDTWAASDLTMPSTIYHHQVFNIKM